jgi:hypothetical protein
MARVEVTEDSLLPVYGLVGLQMVMQSLDKVVFQESFGARHLMSDVLQV